MLLSPTALNVKMTSKVSAGVMLLRSVLRGAILAFAALGHATFFSQLCTKHCEIM